MSISDRLLTWVHLAGVALTSIAMVSAAVFEWTGDDVSHLLWRISLAGGLLALLVWAAMTGPRIVSLRATNSYVRMTAFAGTFLATAGLLNVALGDFEFGITAAVFGASMLIAPNADQPPHPKPAQLSADRFVD